MNARITQDREERDRVKRMLKEKKDEEEMDAATISFIQRSRASDAEIQRCREELQAIRDGDQDDGVMDVEVHQNASQQNLAPAGATAADKSRWNKNQPEK